MKMLKQPMHDQMTGKLRRENKADWWKKDGVYSRETERNASPREWEREFTKLCKLKVEVKNLNKIPKTGKLILIANHDNSDAHKFLAACVDKIRDSDGSRALSASDFERNINLSLKVKNHRLQSGAEELIKEHLGKGNALVIFPRTGDWTTARQDKTQPCFRFMDGFLRFAIENESDILPAHVKLEYPLWWRILWWIVPRDLGFNILQTFYYNIYSNTTMHITFGDVIPYTEISKDANSFYMKRGKKRYPDAVLQKYELAINKLTHIPS